MRQASWPGAAPSAESSSSSQLAGDADREPCLDRLLVGPQAELLVAGEDGDPDFLGAEAEGSADTSGLPDSGLQVPASGS